jgi:hypothetical protein
MNLGIKVACMGRDAALAVLTEKHQEAVSQLGISGKMLVELWRSIQGETWSITMTLDHPQLGKMVCLVLQGTDLTDVIWSLPGLAL